MVAKINVPVNTEGGLVAATPGAARGDGKEEWNLDSGASFHMSPTQAGMPAYKKAPAGTTIEVADGTILPVDRFGTVEVDLDQPGTTTKPVKMVPVGYVPGLSRNLLSTRKTEEQWGKPLVYFETKAFLGFPGEESLVFVFCFCKELFSATCVRRIPSQGAALGLTAKTAEVTRIEAAGQWGPCANVKRSPMQGAVLAVAVKAHDMVEIHHVLAHTSEETTQKTVQTMVIATTGQWGPWEARLQVKEKWQVMQWNDGPEKADSNGVGDEDLGVKPGEDKSVGRRDALQLEVQELELELELEQQPASQERKKEIHEARQTPKRGHKRRRRIPRRSHGGRQRIARKRHGRRHRIARKI